MKVKLIQLPKHFELRGNLTFIQNPQQIPFKIKRVFWIYDVPGGEVRGGHAFKSQQEVIIALSGSLDIVITHTSGQIETFSLNRSYLALYIPPMTWRHIENFSTNSVALHLVDQAYSEADYIREFTELGVPITP